LNTAVENLSQPEENDSLQVKNIVEDMAILRTKCKAVEKIDARVLKNLDSMLDTMYEKKGIGLAANQVGLTSRMIVLDLQENGLKKPMFIINPEILWKSDETRVFQEGCLSVPAAAKSEVRRPSRIKISYLNRNGEKKLLEADGLLATCLQHEVDHLDGILYIDHLSKMKSDFIIKKARDIIKKTKK
jgi:peptide deformylase